MKTLFKNARILTFVEPYKIFRGQLVVENNKIAYVGKKAPEETYDKVINCQGNLLMPGFKNAHSHSAMTFLRSYADDLSLHKWLYDKVFPLEACIKKGDCYELAKIAILEYLTSGITACFDMYYNPLEMAKASIEMGFRTVCLGTVTKFKESVPEMVKSYKTINGMNDLVSYRLGFHAEYTSSEEILKELAKATHELKTPIFAHNSETPFEVNECKKRHDGLTPTQYMDKLGLFDYGGGGFHCLDFDDKDIEIFKKRGLHIVTCPGSNSKLASGIAPVNKYLKEGINIALGTDGPASNNALDFFWEMRLCAVLQKLLNNDPISTDAFSILKMATVGGAKAMGLDNADTLEKGKYADIIMIDLKSPNMQPINNITTNIVYSGSKDNIKMTMINGKILYYNKKFYINEKPQNIYKKCKEITSRIKKEVRENKRNV